MTFSHLEITLDVNEPARMIAFWAAALGYRPADDTRFDTPDRIYWSLDDPQGRGPRVVIQRVPEPVTGKSRLHLDLHVVDIEAEAARIEALGGIRLDSSPITEVDATWIRLQDPEGNLFCLVQTPPH